VIIVRYILSSAILLFAAYVAAMNWGCVITTLRNKRRGIDRHHSTVPLFSFLITVLALMFYPRPDKAVWMLAVPALDIGNWVIVWAPVGLVLLLIRGSKEKQSAEGLPGKNEV
jgi:hypothetical protein